MRRLQQITVVLFSWILFVFCDYEYYEEYYSDDSGRQERVTTTTANITLAGTLKRNLEIPAVGRYVHIMLGKHEERNVTVQLTRVDGREEVVFRYTKGQITPSYHNDVFWYYSDSSFQIGRDGVFCSEQFLTEETCRFSVTEYRSQSGGQTELNLRIQFLGLEQRDDGWYRINAFQGEVEHNVDPKHFQIIVEGPPVFIDELEEELELECDKTVNLSCKAAGKPFAEVAWLELDDRSDLSPVVQNGDISVSQTGSVLSIRENPIFARRTFVCQAKNRKGEVEQIITVTSTARCQHNVNKSDIDYLANTENITTAVQGAVTLSCQVPESGGLYLVQWEKYHDGTLSYVTSWFEGMENEFARGCGQSFGMFTGGYGRTGCKAKQIPTSKTRFLNVGLGSISINWVKRADEGVYTCSVFSLSDPTLVSRSFFHITVFAGPVIDTHSELTTHARIGRPFSLQCGASGKPKPKISWIKDDALIQEHSLQFEVDKLNNVSILHIANMTQEMLGEITCVAKNKEGADSKKFLIVDENTIIVNTKPESVMVKASETAKFDCSGSSLGGRMVTAWYKGNTPVEQVAFLEDRLTQSGDGSIEISNTHPDDSGFYICELTNGMGALETIAAQLRVVERPAEVVYTPEHVHLSLGRPGIIPCYIAPKFLYASWTKDGRIYDPFDDQADCEVDENGFLQFSSVTPEVAGNYTCMPYNSEGSAGRSGVMQVIVHQEEFTGEMFEPLEDTNLPVFLNNTSTEVTADIRESVNLTCFADGSPLPEIVWYKGGQAVHADHNVAVYRHGQQGLYNDGQLLVIKSLRMKDVGEYTCVARNGGKSNIDRIISIELAKLKILENMTVKHVNVIQGSSLSLKCPIGDETRVNKSSEYAVLWFRGEESRPFYVHYSDSTLYSASYGQRHTVTKDEGTAVLERPNTSLNDETSYLCQVNYEEINSPKTIHFTQQVFEVSIEARPSIVSDPKQYFYVTLGESITLRCGIVGAPQPDIHWYKNGKAIEQTDNLVFYKNRTELSISAFLPTNSGNYTCSALNRLGSAHHTVWVSHQNFLIPIQSPKNVTVREGEEANFWCQANSGAGLASYKWLINETYVTELPRVSNRVEIKNDGRELIIEQVEEGDAGLVTCQAANNETQIELSAELAIGTPAMVTQEVEDIHVVLGDSVLLPCHVTADPPVQYVTWSKDSAVYDPHYDSVHLSNGSLLLTEVSGHDSGEYACQPYNSLGNQGGWSQPFLLIID